MSLCLCLAAYPPFPLVFFGADPMTDLPAGVQEPGAVLPCLANSLHNPETALHWLDYVSRFPAAQGLNSRPFRENWFPWMNWDLSWLDLWGFFCVARRVSLVRGRRGPDGESDFTDEFEAIAVGFGVRWQDGIPLYPQFRTDLV
jgi:hypothetical protein